MENAIGKEYVIKIDRCELIKDGVQSSPRLLFGVSGFCSVIFDEKEMERLKPLNNETCIEYLQESGWMQEHDKAIYEEGLDCGAKESTSLEYEQGRKDGRDEAVREIARKQSTVLGCVETLSPFIYVHRDGNPLYINTNHIELVGEESGKANICTFSGDIYVVDENVDDVMRKILGISRMAL